MKFFSLIALVALMAQESQQISLTSKYGVLDMADGDDGTDPMFAHRNVEGEQEMANSMQSLKEAEKEMGNKDADSIGSLVKTMWRWIHTCSVKGWVLNKIVNSSAYKCHRYELVLPRG